MPKTQPMTSLPARLRDCLIQCAVEQSMMSPCQSKRGVVIFAGDDVVSMGYNQKPRGFECDGSDRCKSTCRNEAIHAEQVALLAAGTKARGCDLVHVKTVHSALVASGGPSCVQCSKLALYAGIAGVWLYHADGWQRYDIAEFHRLSVEAALAALTWPAEITPECVAAFEQTAFNIASSADTKAQSQVE